MKKIFNFRLVLLLAVFIIFSIFSIFIINFFKPIENNDGEKIATTANNDKEIITISEVHFSWDKDPNEIDNIIDNNSYIIKVRINKIQEAVLLEEKNGVQHNIPLKPINATVIESIYGNINNTEVNFYAPGGEIRISEIIKTMNEAQIEKIGYDKLSEEKKKNSYISYYSESDYDMKENEEYIIILNKSRDGNYYLSCNGYGIFKESQSDVNAQTNNNIIRLKNCLTGKEVNYTKKGEIY